MFIFRAHRRVQELLSHPKTGLTAVAVSLTATATMVTGFVTGLTPLMAVHGLETLHDDIMKIVVPLGVLAAICTCVANMAESIIKFEDQEDEFNKEETEKENAQVPNQPSK